MGWFLPSQVARSDCGILPESDAPDNERGMTEREAQAILLK